MLLTFDSLGHKLEIGHLNRVQTKLFEFWIPCFSPRCRNWSMIVGTNIGALNAGALAQFPPEAQCSKAGQLEMIKSHRGGSTNHIRAKPDSQN